MGLLLSVQLVMLIQMMPGIQLVQLVMLEMIL